MCAYRKRFGGTKWRLTSRIMEIAVIRIADAQNLTGDLARTGELALTGEVEKKDEVAGRKPGIKDSKVS